MFATRFLLLGFAFTLCSALSCTESNSRVHDGSFSDGHSNDLSVPASTRVVRDPDGYELRGEGTWLVGDLHVHSTGASNDTGGDSFPSAIAAMASERGLNFVVLTDHSNSTGSDPSTLDEDPELFNLGPEFLRWDEVKTYHIPGSFWLVAGNEISPVGPGDPPALPTGHVGCVPSSIEAFDTQTPFIDRPKGSVSGGQALSQALERGCFSILNHPYSLIPWIAFDWTGDTYDAIEVWNGGGGGFDAYDMHSYNAWRCDLLAGKAVTPIGASDNHRVNQPPPGELLDPALGYPSTSVWAEEATWSGIMLGLKNGEVSIHEGETRLYLEVFDGEKRRTKGTVSFVRVSGRLDPLAGPSRLRLRWLESCESTGQVDTFPEVIETFLLDEEVSPGEEFLRIVEVDVGDGVLSATLFALEPIPVLGTHYAGLSRGLRIEPSVSPIP